MEIQSQLLKIREVKTILKNYDYEFKNGIPVRVSYDSEIQEDDFLDILESDYDAGKIKGELIVAEEVPEFSIRITYIDERGKVKRFELEDLREFVETILDILWRKLKIDNMLFCYFLEMSVFLKFMRASFLRDKDLSKFFTKSIRREWKGTLKELAQLAIEQTSEKKYRNLASACRDLVRRYTIEKKGINYNSLYSMTRQMQSGNRF